MTATPPAAVPSPSGLVVLGEPLGSPVAPLGPGAPVASVVSRAAVLRRLELEVLRRLDGLVSGDFRTHAIGPGSERAGARRYEPGDDARRMDWNLTARSLTPHVRTTEADRELETWVVADCSASMDFGTADREKRDVMLGAAAAYGILTVRAGNRFGMLVSGGPTLQRRPATTGRGGLLAALAAVHDADRHGGSPGAGADLPAALALQEKTARRRGLVVVISDFLDRGEWGAPLRRLALRHQVVAVHVTDPRESELPAVGMLTVVDPETGRQLHVQTSSEKLRARYAAAAAERAAAIRGTIGSAGAEYLHLSTDRDWITDVITHTTRRHAHRRAAARIPGPSSTPWQPHVRSAAR